MYGAKIRMIREMRGLSQENVADSLNISQSTYSLYESNKIAVTTDMLDKIAKVLDVNPADLVNQQPVVFHIPNNRGTKVGYINEYNSDSQDASQKVKELYEALLTAKDETIASKNIEIERLQKIIEKLLGDK
ncbi:helix-turn-helix domain-containing protein [Leadbetterella sp. DM7]|uniref:helix-turn-helix domain-containing protein n=1 Tax=Leadbetterella sp. DM7 TaxID=3235085 RepID=UPI00349E9CB1